MTITKNATCLVSGKDFYQVAKFSKKKNQKFLKEKSSPPCETPSQDQEGTESQEYSLSLSSLLGQK